jgi:hypothetical protein
MPDYTARRRELAAQYETLRTELAIPLAHALELRLADLAIARKTALELFESDITKSGTEPIAKSFAAKCDAALVNVVVPLPSFLNTMREDDAVVVEDWIEATSTADSKFFKGLAEAQLGEIRDAMVVLNQDLRSMIDILERKWATLSEENQRLERLEQEASAAMTAAMQKAISDGTSIVARSGEQARRMLDPMMKIPDIVNDAMVYLAIEAGIPEEVAKLIPKISLVGKDTFAGAKELGIKAGDVSKALQFLMRDPGMAVSETIQRAIGPEMEALVTVLGQIHKYLLPTLSGEYQRQVDAYQRALPNQGSILVCLSQTRRDVDAFLDICGMEQLQALYEKAMRALEEWVGAQASDGLRADATEFREAAKKSFDQRFHETTQLFEEFVRANQGRFVGTIERDTENALLWTDIWADRVQGIANLGMDARLREWRASTITVTEQFEGAARQIRQQLLGLPIGVAEPMCKAIDEVFERLRRQLREVSEPAVEAMESVASTVTPDRISRDLDRSRVREQLYA